MQLLEWNKLRILIKEAQNVQTFERNVKRKLLGNISRQWHENLLLFQWNNLICILSISPVMNCWVS